MKAPAPRDCMLQTEPGARLHPTAGGPRGPSQSGFTLMEILIALAVLSIVAVSAVKAGGNAINNLIYLQQQTFGHWVALNKAAELELAPVGWEQEERQGTAHLADRRWSWAYEIHDTPEPAMRRVEIEVWHDERTGEPVALLTLYRRR